MTTSVPESLAPPTTRRLRSSEGTDFSKGTVEVTEGGN